MTKLAHEIVGELVSAGDTVIDATAGNGNDTVFLAGLTGDSGRVLAIDLQSEALEVTRQRVIDQGYRHVELMQQSHESPLSLAPEPVTAIMFNLG